MTSEQLEALLTKHFPKDATSWSQATDEVRDICRHAREIAGLPEECAVDFSATSMRTPSQWNTRGIAGTIYFYLLMEEEQQQTFINYVTELFPFIFKE